MSDKKYLDENGLIRFAANLINKFATKTHTHDDIYYTEAEVDAKVSSLQASIDSVDDAVDDIASGTVVVKEAEHAASADSATTATNANHATTADSADEAEHAVSADSATTATNANHAATADNATTANSATKAVQDGNGNVITETYETKIDAVAKLTEAKSYADTAASTVKNDLLNGAGAAYDTLKELGDLIDANVDAIDALETIASGKADADHTHDDRYYTESEIDSKISTLNTAISGKAASSHSHTISAGASDDDVVVLTGTAGTNGVSYSATHANSGVTAGTYKSVTVNAKGHITAGSNPTTLSGYGITDAYTKSAIDSALSGKATSSHSHTIANVTNLQTTLDSIEDSISAIADGDTVVAEAEHASSADEASTCTGNAATATKLATARTISLTGDVTGSATFDGSANASITATVADDSHNHVISNVDGLQAALNAKMGDFSIEIYNGNGGVNAIKLVTVNYSTCTSENGVAAKISMVSGHGNGSSYAFLQDVIIKVGHTGTVSVDNYKYYEDVTTDSYTHGFNGYAYGDIFWVIDTTNTIVDFYCVVGQYSRVYQTPWKRLTYSSGGTVTQYTSATKYSSGTKNWANNTMYAMKSDIPEGQDLSAYATKATTLSGYGITDAYTKTQVDTTVASLQSSIDGKAASSHSHSAATTSAAGFMSATDKAKLDGIAAGANAYSHPTTSGNKHIPSGGSSGQILRWSADGTAAWGADNNTTYSAGTGISLSGTTFSNSGVRSIATGTSNGTISVNTNGTSANVAVKGLGSAAYTASTAYDAAGTAQTKADAALASAKSYADGIKNDLLNGAGTAYDTLKELGDLIDDNTDAIDALETVAANKANASDLTSHVGNKSNPHGVTAAQVGALPISGGTMTGELIVNGGDAVGASKIVLANNKGQITNSATQTLFGFLSAGNIAIGHNDYNTQMRGKASRPTYNGSEIALRSDIPEGQDLSAYATKATTLAGYGITDAYTKTEVDTTVASLQSSIDGKAASSHSHSAATSSAAGLMSASDKAKLDGIAAGANNYTYTLPTASSSTLGGVKTTSTVTSTSGLTACPIISGVPYYKDTNTTYSLSSFGITATATELNYCDGVTSNIQTQLDGKAASSHTHNYAGSSSAGGSATSAVKLDTSAAGSATQPVYFSGGKPVACTYTLSKSVPSDAKFTDTTYSAISTSYINGMFNELTLPELM